MSSLEAVWRVGTPAEVNDLLSKHHYLGPISSGANLVILGEVSGFVVAAQVWRHPTSRHLPQDGSWLELSRWCLTPAAGENAGSRQHRYAVREIRQSRPSVTTLVSYSDPTEGHTGALYRACNWRWAPTWHRLRPPPTGQGNWGTAKVQPVKDRWIFPVRKDRRRDEVLLIKDNGAIRRWRSTASEIERKWARDHPELRDALG